MCLYPKLVNNPKYLPNKKNGGIVPHLHDDRIKYVPIGCGRCYECRKQRRMEWVSRLMFEADHNRHRGWFVTFTVSDASMKRFYAKMFEDNGGEEIPYYSRLNGAMAVGVKWWRERVRKMTGKSPRFWLCTELGEENGRIHMHGFVWNNNIEIFDLWDYGWKMVKPLERSKIKYATKYVFKTLPAHKKYVPKIFCSNGIGAGYESTYNAGNNAYAGENTDERYRTNNGYFIALPRYYRNKLYSEEEREKLWLHKLDKCERWVMGIRIDISTGYDEYYRVLDTARRKSVELGFDVVDDWEEDFYKKSLKRLQDK